MHSSNPWLEAILKADLEELEDTLKQDTCAQIEDEESDVCKISIDPESVDLHRFSLITGHHMLEPFQPQFSSSSDEEDCSPSRRFESLAGISEFRASEASSSSSAFDDACSPAPSDWADPVEPVEIVELSSDSERPAKKPKRQEPFECELCGKGFKFKGGLTKHRGRCQSSLV